MNQPNTTSWKEQVYHLLDHANVSLQHGNRDVAADKMVRASELLFLQAKEESDLEAKKLLIKRATEILERSVRLADGVSANNFTTTSTPKKTILSANNG